MASMLVPVAMVLLLAMAVQNAYAVYSYGNFPCSNVPGLCQWMSIPCPSDCPLKCTFNCRTCNSHCGCNRKGAVCQDPRFIGGDGVMFYFHGKRDQSFCLVSDADLHINALFIGKERDGGKSRDFTWVKSLGIMFGSHKLYVGAKKVGTWDENADNLALVLDSTPIVLTLATGSTWMDPKSGLQIIRNKATNAISLELEGRFSIEVVVVPITAQESRVHNYGITEDDCFAHLDLHFKFFNLTPKVHGVLGHTYAPGFVSKVKRSVAMPIMGGDDLYATSSLFASDCLVSQFGHHVAPSDQDIEMDEQHEVHLPSLECGSGGAGMVCRR